MTARNCAVKMSNRLNGAQGHSYLRVRQVFNTFSIREMFEKCFYCFKSGRTLNSMNISSWEPGKLNSFCLLEVSMRGRLASIHY